MLRGRHEPGRVNPERDRPAGQSVYLRRPEAARRKTDSAAAFAQERLNAVWELVLTLPAYRALKLDEACYFHTFQGLMADKEKWDQVQDPSAEGYAIYQGMMAGLACFAESIRGFRQQVTEMTRTYFGPLKRRTSDAYAQAVPQLRAVLPADRRVQHLLPQQCRPQRAGAHLPEGGRSP